MKLNIQFGEETRFIVPIRQIIRTRTRWLSGTMHKPWSHTGSFGSPLREIIAKYRNALEIPTGYQTETGFLFGVEPAE